MRIAFLDRDGTLVPEQADDAWAKVSQLDLIPGTVDALKDLQALGYELVIITNQYPIGEGKLTLTGYELLARSFLDALAEHEVQVLDVFYCPHARDEGCDCRKPLPRAYQTGDRKVPRHRDR